MKKTLSLILAVMMLLGTLSTTAFAAPPPDMLSVCGTNIVSAAALRPGVTDESGKLIGIDAITAGTVTYTAPEDNGGIYKLTLNNATIAPEGHKYAIDTDCTPLEIELIGVNTVSVTGICSTIAFNNSNVTFSGTGSLIVHGGTNTKYPTITTYNSTVTLPLGYTAVGSTSKTETNVENMTKVSLDEVEYEQYTYYVGETAAQTVVIYNPYFDSTDITLKVAKELSYEMVIPEDVDNLNNFGVFEVGQAKVTNVKNATDNTVISYTAETTNFKCDGKTDIPASYYTDAEGATAFPTEAVEVYKNKADSASIPTMYVGISENDYNAAENGTYTATVTFNFSAEEKEPAPQMQDVSLFAKDDIGRVYNGAMTFTPASGGSYTVNFINGLANTQLPVGEGTFSCAKGDLTEAYSQTMSIEVGGTSYNLPAMTAIRVVVQITFIVEGSEEPVANEPITLYLDYAEYATASTDSHGVLMIDLPVGVPLRAEFENYGSTQISAEMNDSYVRISPR